MTQICPSPSESDAALGKIMNVEPATSQPSCSKGDFHSSSLYCPSTVDSFSSQQSVTRQNIRRGPQKRKHNFVSGYSGFRAKHGRRDKIVLPTKFLLGGNINDPLNLNSIAMCAGGENSPIDTPKPSPARLLNEPLEVVIPRNKRDPLNLNTSTASDKGTSRKARKRRKRTHSLRLNFQEAKELSERSAALVHEFYTGPRDASSLSDSELGSASIRTKAYRVSTGTLDLRVGSSVAGKTRATSHDPIVSPVSIKLFEPGRQSPGKRERESMPSDRRRKSSGMMHSAKVIRRQSNIGATGATQHADTSTDTYDHTPFVTHASHFARKSNSYRFGNYDRYYGYRLPSRTDDPRLKLLKREMFENKDVLDIGCNVGYVTWTIGRECAPRRILGIDIDPKLISIARKNLRHYLDAQHGAESKYPPSFAKIYGPVSAPEVAQTSTFPNNVFFQQANYVLDCDELVECVQPEYDVILALSITKWVHLNWGDAGMKRFFRRVFNHLRPGGTFIVEPQPLQSYQKAKKQAPELAVNYTNITFLPDQFMEFLLKDVGFSKSECLGSPQNKAKGFRRPMFVLRKPLDL